MTAISLAIILILISAFTNAVIGAMIKPEDFGGWCIVLAVILAGGLILMQAA